MWGIWRATWRGDWSGWRRPLIHLLIRLHDPPATTFRVPEVRLFPGAEASNSGGLEVEVQAWLRGGKACESEVVRSEQGSFDCAFPRWARECCAQDDRKKIGEV